MQPYIIEDKELSVIKSCFFIKSVLIVENALFSDTQLKTTEKLRFGTHNSILLGKLTKM